MSPPFLFIYLFIFKMKEALSNVFLSWSTLRNRPIPTPEHFRISYDTAREMDNIKMFCLSCDLNMAATMTGDLPNVE